MLKKNPVKVAPKKSTTRLPSDLILGPISFRSFHWYSWRVLCIPWRGLGYLNLLSSAEIFGLAQYLASQQSSCRPSRYLWDVLDQNLQPHQEANWLYFGRNQWRYYSGSYSRLFSSMRGQESIGSPSLAASCSPPTHELWVFGTDE